jgi:hypothetical protein
MKASTAMKPLLIFSIALLSCADAIAQPPVPPQQWGTILGRVIYDGPAPKLKMKRAVNSHSHYFKQEEVPDESLVVGKNGGLANVFVYLHSKPSAIHPDYVQAKPKKVLLEFHNSRYVPHALGIWKQDTLDYQNREKYATNPVFKSKNSDFNILVFPEENSERTFTQSESKPELICSHLHPWAEAILLVRDNPYFFVTNERGNFCIPNLPANEELEFVFWHERVGFLKNIKSDGETFTTNDKGRVQTKLTQPVTDFGEFKIDPKLFEVSR